MFFIFGWGHRTTRQYVPTISAKYTNCGNETWFHLLAYRNWFTLFFIPIIPYESKNLLLCPVCLRGLEFQGDQVHKARHLNELTTEFPAKRMPESEYLDATKEARLLE